MIICMPNSANLFSAATHNNTHIACSSSKMGIITGNSGGKRRRKAAISGNKCNNWLLLADVDNRTPLRDSTTTTTTTSNRCCDITTNAANEQQQQQLQLRPTTCHRKQALHKLKLMTRRENNCTNNIMMMSHHVMMMKQTHNSPHLKRTQGATTVITARAALAAIKYHKLFISKLLLITVLFYSAMQTNYANYPAVQAQEANQLPTVIVRGFLNFRTTVDNTVLLFTPDANNNANIEPSASSTHLAEATRAQATEMPSIEQVPKYKQGGSVVQLASSSELSNIDNNGWTTTTTTSSTPASSNNNRQLQQIGNSDNSIISNGALMFGDQPQPVGPAADSTYSAATEWRPVSATQTPSLPVSANYMTKQERQHQQQHRVSPSQVDSGIELYPTESQQLSISKPIVNQPDKGGDLPTGLVTILASSQVTGPMTTLYHTQVIGTSIDGRYAQVLRSTSAIVNNLDQESAFYARAASEASGAVVMANAMASGSGSSIAVMPTTSPVVAGQQIVPSSTFTLGNSYRSQLMSEPIDEGTGDSQQASPTSPSPMPSVQADDVIIEVTNESTSSSSSPPQGTTPFSGVHNGALKEQQQTTTSVPKQTTTFSIGNRNRQQSSLRPPSLSTTTTASSSSNNNNNEAASITTTSRPRSNRFNFTQGSARSSDTLSTVAQPADSSQSSVSPLSRAKLRRPQLGFNSTANQQQQQQPQQQQQSGSSSPTPTSPGIRNRFGRLPLPAAPSPALLEDNTSVKNNNNNNNNNNLLQQDSTNGQLSPFPTSSPTTIGGLRKPGLVANSVITASSVGEQISSDLAQNSANATSAAARSRSNFTAKIRNRFKRPQMKGQLASSAANKQETAGADANASATGATVNPIMAGAAAAASNGNNDKQQQQPSASQQQDQESLIANDSNQNNKLQSRMGDVFNIGSGQSSNSLPVVGSDEILSVASSRDHLSSGQLNVGFNSDQLVHEFMSTNPESMLSEHELANFPSHHQTSSSAASSSSSNNNNNNNNNDHLSSSALNNNGGVANGNKQQPNSNKGFARFTSYHQEGDNVKTTSSSAPPKAVPIHQLISSQQFDLQDNSGGSSIVNGNSNSNLEPQEELLSSTSASARAGPVADLSAMDEILTASHIDQHHPSSSQDPRAAPISKAVAKSLNNGKLAGHLDRRNNNRSHHHVGTAGSNKPHPITGGGHSPLLSPQGAEKKQQQQQQQAASGNKLQANNQNHNQHQHKMIVGPLQGILMPSFSAEIHGASSSHQLYAAPSSSAAFAPSDAILEPGSESSALDGGATTGELSPSSSLLASDGAEQVVAVAPTAADSHLVSGTIAATPPLKTITSSFATTMTSSRTRLVPLQQGTTSAVHTITEQYLITKMITTLQTMPPGEFILTDSASSRTPQEILNEFEMAQYKQQQQQLSTNDNSKNQLEQPIVAPPSSSGSQNILSPSDMEQPIEKSPNDWLHDFSNNQLLSNDPMSSQSNSQSSSSQPSLTSLLEGATHDVNGNALSSMANIELDQLASTMDPTGSIQIPDLNNPLILAAAIQNPQLAAVILAAQQLQLKRKQQLQQALAAGANSSSLHLLPMPTNNNPGAMVPRVVPIVSLPTYSTTYSTVIKPTILTVKDTLFTTRLVSFKDGRTVRTRTVSEPGSVIESTTTTMATEVTPVTITIKPSTTYQTIMESQLSTQSLLQQLQQPANLNAQNINNALIAAQLATVLNRRRQQLSQQQQQQQQMAALIQPSMANSLIYGARQQQQQQADQQQQAKSNTNNNSQFQPQLQQLLQSLQQQQQQQQQQQTSTGANTNANQLNQQQQVTGGNSQQQQNQNSNNNGNNRGTQQQVDGLIMSSMATPPLPVMNTPQMPIITTLTSTQVKTYTIHNAFKTIFRTITSTSLITTTLMPGAHLNTLLAAMG